MANQSVDADRSTQQIGTDGTAQHCERVRYAPSNESGMGHLATHSAEWLVTEACEANKKERGITLREASEVYWKAVVWSAAVSLSAVVEGYGATVVGSYPGIPAVRRKFGLISDEWMEGFTAAAGVGTVIGSLVIPHLILEKLGYRWTIILLLVASSGLSFISTFADTLPVFLVGVLLQSAAWGAFQPTALAYAAELCPTALRHILIAFVLLCWIIGQLAATSIIVSYVSQYDEWGYRIPFALQCVWVIPIVLIMYFAPESPWWYVQKGDLASGLKSLLKLMRKSSERDAGTSFTLMVYINEVEKKATKGASYLNCFRGPNLRRTGIVCMVFIANATSHVVSGSLWQTLFMQGHISMRLQSILNWLLDGICLVTGFILILLLNRVDRKRFVSSCMCVVLVGQLVLGFMGIHRTLSNSESIAAGTLAFLISAVANLLIPVLYTIAIEVPATRLRVKSIVLAHAVSSILDMGVVHILQKEQLTSQKWNWGLKSYLFWAGINFIIITYIHFYLPETKGRTYGGLNMLFENGVPARQFKSSKVDPFTADIGNTGHDLFLRLIDLSAMECQTRDVVSTL